MKPTNDLTDAQWCVLDLLMRARAKGVDRVDRREILDNETLPVDVRAKLGGALVFMGANGSFVEWIGEHAFAITQKGIEIYNLRFNNTEPSAVADEVIALQDRSQ